VEAQGLDLIALEADGSVRDALSLLDRILSATPDKQILCDMVVDRLGVLDRRIMHELTHALFEKDVPTLISVVDRVNDTGVDLKKFYGDLITHVRHLNIIQRCGPDHPAVNLPADEKQQIHSRVADLPEAYLGHLLQVLLTDEDMVKRTAHTRIAIETVLFKLARVREGAAIDHIIRQLDLLARQTGSGTALPDTPTSGRSSSPASPPLPERPESKASGTGPSGLPEAPPVYQTAAEPPPPVNGIREPVDPAPPSAPEIPRTWDGFLRRIETQMPFIHVLLTRGKVTSETETELVFHLSGCTGFDKKRLTDKQKELDRQCRKFLGKTLTVHVQSDPRHPARAAAAADDSRARQAAAQHPLVQHAQELFDGEIINI
jgi:DNA polymerase-3 subunit gamma/tau